MNNEIKNLKVTVLLIPIVLASILLANNVVGNLIDDYKKTYNPIKYSESTKTIQIKQFDANVYTRIDAESGVTYIVTHNGGLFSSSETVIEKRNSDGSLYITPKSDIKELINKAEVTQ